MEPNSRRAAATSRAAASGEHSSARDISLVVETAQIAEQQRRPAVESEHGEGALDGVDATGADVVDLDANRSGATPEHPADALRPGWKALTVPACAGDRAIEGRPAVDAQTRGWVAARVMDAAGDEGHGVGLVIDQVRGIRDEIIELLACGCGKLARLGSDVC